MLASYGANLVNITLEITTNILIDEEAVQEMSLFFFINIFEFTCDGNYFFVFFLLHFNHRFSLLSKCNATLFSFSF